MDAGRPTQTQILTGQQPPAGAESLHAAGLPDLLSVTDVMARYRVRDRRTARRIMEDAGCFTIRGSAYIYVDDLTAYERNSRITAPTDRSPSPPRTRGRRKAGPSEETGYGLARHWWQPPTDSN